MIEQPQGSPPASCMRLAANLHPDGSAAFRPLQAPQVPDTRIFGNVHSSVPRGSDVNVAPRRSPNGHAKHVRPPEAGIHRFRIAGLVPFLRGHRAAGQIGALAWKEFSDRFSSGWVIACVLVWLGAIGFTSFFGLAQIGRIGVQGYERTVLSLLNLVQYLVPLLALLVGHDLVVGEHEERTLPLLLASGVSRGRLLAGKFLGGCAALAFPLLLGFALAGTVIGLAAKDNGFGPFLLLAASGLGLGIVFLGIGLLVSTFCRTRVQALVVALLVWCVSVFVFDLVALGVLVSTRAPAAAHEIEVVCDTTHVNAAADLHAAYEVSADATKGPGKVGPRIGAAAEEGLKAGSPERVSGFRVSNLSWLLINPVDLFRAINLSKQMNASVPLWAITMTVSLWLTVSLGASLWKFRRLDL